MAAALLQTQRHSLRSSRDNSCLQPIGANLSQNTQTYSDLQAARTDSVSTKQNGSGPSSNGASISEETTVNGRYNSNGSSPHSVVTGTDLQERPYSKNGNGASLDYKASSYAEQGSPAQRRETAVADALQDAAEDKRQQDPGAGKPQHLPSSKSKYTEADIAPQSSAAQQQQEAAVQDVLQTPKVKASGSSRWSRVGKYSTFQVNHS